MNELTIATPATMTFKSAALAKETRTIAAIGADIKTRNVELAKAFGRIKSGKLYEEDGFKSVAEYAEKIFGIKKAMAYQLATVGERFYNADSGTAKKLSEMLPTTSLAEISGMTDDQLETAIGSGAINEFKTQAELREVAKANKDQKPKVLKDFQIDATIIYGKANQALTAHFDATPFETFEAELVSKHGFIEPTAKKFSDVCKIYYCQKSGNFAKVIYSAVEAESKRKNGKVNNYTVAELEAMLKAAKEAESK